MITKKFEFSVTNKLTAKKAQEVMDAVNAGYDVQVSYTKKVRSNWDSANAVYEYSTETDFISVKDGKVIIDSSIYKDYCSNTWYNLYCWFVDLKNKKTVTKFEVGKTYIAESYKDGNAIASIHLEYVSDGQFKFNNGNIITTEIITKLKDEDDIFCWSDYESCTFEHNGFEFCIDANRYVLTPKHNLTISECLIEQLHSIVNSLDEDSVNDNIVDAVYEALYHKIPYYLRWTSDLGVVHYNMYKDIECFIKKYCDK